MIWPMTDGSLTEDVIGQPRPLAAFQRLLQSALRLWSTNPFLLTGESGAKIKFAIRMFGRTYS